MAIPRKCTECGALLPPNASHLKKTCSDGCRAKRHRRLVRARKQRGATNREKTKIPDEFKEMLETAGHEVAKEELRPVVREAMTEEAMQSLQNMVGLLPLVVAQLQKDVSSDDPVVRQKAHSMILRYTLGHEKALPPDEKQPPGVNVIFTMPRPGQQPDTSAPEVSDTETPPLEDVVELRECDTCREQKPTSEFLEGALRCNACVESFQARARALIAPPKPVGEEDA